MMSTMSPSVTWSPVLYEKGWLPSAQPLLALVDRLVERRADHLVGIVDPQWTIQFLDAQ
jgi:hypothetical protein